MIDSTKKLSVIIGFVVVVLLLFSNIVYVNSSKYVVDEEYNEQERSRSNFQITKERIVIGYLSGTSLFHTNIKPDFSRTIPAQVPDVPSSDNSITTTNSDSKKLIRKVLFRRRKRRRTVRIYRDPQTQQQQNPVVNRNKCDDEAIHFLPVEEQAKCFKIRPASLNLQGW